MILTIDSEVKARFPGLQVLAYYVKGVKVKKEDAALEKFREQIVTQVREKFDLESLKNVPVFRAYRDFFWEIGIDPTKVRPAAEALIRRILRGEAMPNINNVVDAYNLASINTEIALAAFDEDRLRGELLMRLAKAGEKFLGIGMEKPMTLEGGEIVISDEEKLIAIYPYRDAEYSKVTEETKNVLLLVCGVPGIEEERLLNAGQLALSYVTKFCRGRETT